MKQPTAFYGLSILVNTDVVWLAAAYFPPGLDPEEPIAVPATKELLERVMVLPNGHVDVCGTVSAWSILDSGKRIYIPEGGVPAASSMELAKIIRAWRDRIHVARQEFATLPPAAKAAFEFSMIGKIRPEECRRLLLPMILHRVVDQQEKPRRKVAGV